MKLFVLYFDPNPPGKDEVAVKIEFLDIQPLTSQSVNGVHKAFVDSIKDKKKLFVLYFDPNPSGKDEVAVKTEFLVIQPLTSQLANSVHKAIIDSIKDLNIINDKHGLAEEKYFSETSMCKRIVGFTTDGALVNRGENASIKTLLRETSLWVVFTWCIAHRLEPAVKDSLSNEYEFKEINEMLLRLYYLYHKAPKKLCQLRELSHALAGAMEYHGEVENLTRLVELGG